MNALNHRFKIEFKSCDGETWVDRSQEASCSNNYDPYEMACDTARRNMNVTERGVRVTYLGVFIICKGEKATTPINPFTVTIERK